jgi:hypothetical protein
VKFNNRRQFDVADVFRILPALTVFIFWLMAIAAAIYFEVQFLIRVNFSDTVMSTVIRCLGYLLMPLTVIGFVYVGYQFVRWIGQWTGSGTPKNGPPTPTDIATVAAEIEHEIYPLPGAADLLSSAAPTVPALPPSQIVNAAGVCPQCGYKPLRPHARFCPHCQNKVAP